MPHSGPQRDGDEHRGPGRPRDHATDDAALRAAMDLLADGGWDAMTMEAVAERVGVAKTTIYRRWPTRLDLLMAVAEAMTAPVRPPEPRGLEQDLVTILADVIRVLDQPLARRLIPRALADARENPELAAVLRPFWAQRRSLVLDVLRGALDRGELAADADLERVADALYGSIYYRYLVTGAPIAPEDAATTVRLALDGVRRPA